MSQNAAARPTCTTCRLVFESSQLQRAHHQSEWHLYNMRRKMASLEPVTLEEFERKAAEYRQSPTRVAEEHVCKLCNKRFHSLESYNDHLQSKRHVENSRTRKEKEIDEAISRPLLTPAKADLEKAPAVVKEATVVQLCLFCSFVSRDLERNLEHMSAEHSFFIPDLNYCVTLEGLLTYLHDKVATRHLCLWCSDKSKAFQSLSAVQTHMRDKGHCKLFHYDNAIAELTDFYDYRRRQEEDGDTGEETDSDSDSDDSDLDFAVVDDSGYQLYLPSGAVAGHRSLLRYYQQNLRAHIAANPSGNAPRMKRIMGRYKRLGWSAPSKAAVVVKAKEQKFIMRFQARAYLRVGVKSNALQRHFRKQATFVLKCGYVRTPFKGGKTNGSQVMQAAEVDPRSFPWTVLITARSKHKDVPICVGTLIMSGEITKTYYVLTAASCIHSTKLAKMRVFYRDLDAVAYKKVGVQRILVPQIASPSRKYFGRNIGLLKVAEAIPMSEYSHVACVPFEKDSLLNATCFVNYISIGDTGNPEHSRVYQVQPKLLGNEACEDEYFPDLPKNAICLSDAERREEMVKNGAPLVCKIGKRYTIFGLYDRQTAANASMFTSVLHHLRFLQFIRNKGQQAGAGRTFIIMD